MNFEKLTKDNIDFFAVKNYRNPHCSSEKEFNEDMKRFRYIKRLLNKYQLTGDLKDRLILNHMIILNNVFGYEAAATLLLFKINHQYWSELKTFMIYLNMLDDGELSEVEIDDVVMNSLKKL